MLFVSPWLCRTGRCLTVLSGRAQVCVSAAKRSAADESAFSARPMSTKVAVLGSGLAGSSCASALSKQGHAVDVFDMGFRGPGGRAATRKYDGRQFDHGCQFLGEGVPETFMRDLATAGVIQMWKGRFGLIDSAGQFKLDGHLCSNDNDFCGLSSGAALYVGMPGMSGICEHLTEASGITTHWRHQVTGLDRSPSGDWSLKAKVRQPGDAPDKQATYDSFGAVVLADTLLTKPGSPGSLDLQALQQSDVVQRMRSVTAHPATSLMAVLPADDSIPFDAAVVDDPVIKWVAKDSAKPGRQASPGHTCWTVVSTSAWAQQVLQDDAAKAMTRNPAEGPDQLPQWALSLLEKFEGILQKAGQGKEIKPVLVASQRWGSAFKANLVQEPCLVDKDIMLAACGDFCRQSSAAGAIASGLAAAEQLHKAWSQRT